MKKKQSGNAESELSGVDAAPARRLTHNLRKFADAMEAGDVETALRALAVERVTLKPFMSRKRSRFRPAASVLDAYLILQRATDQMRAAVIERLSANSGRASRDPLSVLVRALVPYRPDLVGGPLLKGVHRDVRAVKYLLSRGLRPDQVATEAAKPGQGIETWALAYTNAKADARLSQSVEPVEASFDSTSQSADADRPVSPSSLRLTWTDSSGKVRRVDTLGLTLDDDGEPVRASISAAILLLRRLETAARRKAAIASARKGVREEDV